MQEKVLEILQNNDRALTVEEIGSILGFETASDYQALGNLLRQLVNESIVYHSNKDKYMLLELSHLKKGVLRTNRKGFGFVDVENQEEDVYINKDNLNGAIHNDIVLVEMISKKNLSKTEGRILKIVERTSDEYIGEIVKKKGDCFVELDDDKVNLEIEIPRKKIGNLVEGHKVKVKLTNKIANNRYYGEVIKIIGHKHDPGVDILSIVYKYNINDIFSDKTLEEVSKIPSEVLPEEKEGRRDLTNEVIFTIDGDDTRDIDDAIAINKLDNGNYLLGVHIADVSYYVKEGTSLDDDAVERGTSVYLVDRVIPMLPHELSNGICSLNPNVERLAMSCDMEIDSDGKVVNYEIYESVIKSNIQMTYKKVNKFLEEGIVEEGYESFTEKLTLMKELSDILRKMKDKRGYLDFDVDEAKILVDETGKPTEVVLRNRGTGERIIEDFMIAANEAVATHIFYMNLPFIYRIHEFPKEEKISSYLTFLGNLGITTTGNMKSTNPKAIQNLLESLKDREEFKILSSLLLRNMQKAIYSSENKGHYGLASKCYTHFTSPIRRYPDTTVHRLLRTYLVKGKMDSGTTGYWEKKLLLIADHSSIKERAAIDCEREVEDMKMAEYMEEHIGEEFEGMISSVTSFGMFIELDNLIEGLVPIKDMKDFFHFDELTLSLVGERTKAKYTIGERVLVKVVKASKEDKTIDFEIIKKL